MLTVCVYLPQKQQQGQKSPGSVEEKGADSPSDHPEEESPSVMARAAGGSKMAATSSLSDGSDKDSGPQGSSNDADSEASESEWTPWHPSGHSHGGRGSTPTQSPTPATLSALYPRTQHGGAVEQLVSAVHKMNLGPDSADSPSTHCPEDQGEPHPQQSPHSHHQGAFKALSHSYTPCSKECSVQSCLHQFTSVELLMGNNKLLCESCTDRRQKQLRKSTSAG